MTLAVGSKVRNEKKRTQWRKYRGKEVAVRSNQENENNGKTCDNVTETNDFYTTDGKLQKKAAAAFAVATVTHKQQQVTNGRDKMWQRRGIE